MGVIVAEEVGQPEHRIEDERSARWRRAPVRAIRCEQQLELGMTKGPVEHLLHGKVTIRIELSGITTTEVVQQAEHVGVLHDGKKIVQCMRFFWKCRFKLPQIGFEIGWHGKKRTIREMKLIHWIHFDPTRGHAEIPQELASHSLRVPEQGIKMRGGIKGVAFAPKHTAIAPDHVVLLDQQDGEPLTCEEVGAHQTADTGANDDGIIRRLWPALYSAKWSTHAEVPSRCARTVATVSFVGLRKFTTGNSRPH